MRRAILISLAVTAALLWVSSPAVGKVKLKKVGRFDTPTYVASSPSFGGIFVVERPGRVIYDAHGKRTVALDIRGEVSTAGERGLLSIAFAPNRSNLVYAYYTNGGGDITIAEFRVAGSQKKPRFIQPRQVLVIPHPNFSNHNGGQLQFGPDGYLYLGTGDGGGAGDSDNSAQTTNNLLGKILRIDPTQHGSAPYTSPTSNAYAGSGRPEIFAIGLRNPYRFSFDRNRIVIGDVGQDRFEEVDYEDLATANGANFGWNDFEGLSAYEGAIAPPPPRNDKPIYAYPHAGGNCTVIGGYVVRGKPKKLKGKYVFGDFCTGRIQTMVPTLNGATKVRTLKVKVPMLNSFGLGPNGALYAASLNGAVYRFK